MKRRIRVYNGMKIKSRILDYIESKSDNFKNLLKYKAMIVALEFMQESKQKPTKELEFYMMSIAPERSYSLKNDLKTYKSEYKQKIEDCLSSLEYYKTENYEKYKKDYFELKSIDKEYMALLIIEDLFDIEENRSIEEEIRKEEERKKEVEVDKLRNDIDLFK